MRDVPAFEEDMPVKVDVFEDRLEIRKLRSAPFLKLPLKQSC